MYHEALVHPTQFAAPLCRLGDLYKCSSLACTAPAGATWTLWPALRPAPRVNWACPEVRRRAPAYFGPRKTLPRATMERIDGVSVGLCAHSPYLRPLTLHYRQVIRPARVSPRSPHPPPPTSRPRPRPRAHDSALSGFSELELRPAAVLTAGQSTRNGQGRTSEENLCFLQGRFDWPSVSDRSLMLLCS